MAFNPNLQSDLKDVKAQGANVGDVREGYRWSGVNWEPSGGGSSSGGSGGSYEDTVKRSIEMMKEANKPAIASYEASIPEITSNYAGQKANLSEKETTLKDRYKNLLDSITTNKTADINKQTVVTSNELGKRGLLPSSTLAQQEVINATTPITDKYNQLQTQTNLDETSGLQDLAGLQTGLTTAESADKRAITNAIAQLQSGGAAQGIQLGSQQYNADQQRILAQQEQQYKAQQDAIANAQAQQQLANQTAQTQYNVKAPYFKPDAPVTAPTSYYGSNTTTKATNTVESRPKNVAKVGTFSPSGQWYQTNDGWAKVVK